MFLHDLKSSVSQFEFSYQDALQQWQDTVFFTLPFSLPVFTTSADGSHVNLIVHETVVCPSYIYSVATIDFIVDKNVIEKEASLTDRFIET